MKLKLCSCSSVVVALCAVASISAAPSASPLDAVGNGSIVIYNVAELTDGRQDDADQIAEVIKATTGLILWRGVRPAAALVATPQQLSVKADRDVQETVSRLLQMFHETRNLFFRIDYKVVTAADAPALAKAILNDPEKEDSFKVTSTIVADSYITIPNGDDATLIDGNVVPLPTIRVTPTFYANRSGLGINVRTSEDPPAASNPGTVVSLELNHAVGIRIQTNNGPAWLILRPQGVERDWLPIGSVTLSRRE